MRLAVGNFLGENRAIHPKLLPDGVGTVSMNQHPGRGDLRPWNQPGNPLATVHPQTKTIYRMGRDVPSDTAYWLEWKTVVHVMRGFLAEDTTERTYYTGDGPPKVTDNTMALTSAPYPSAYRPLGIPAPLTKPLVAPADPGVAESTEDRYYVYTYVSDWGEEGPASPPSDVMSCKTDATATISGFAPVPSGYSHINKMRIYRTQSGSTGGTNFFFVKEVSGWGPTLDDVTTLGEGISTTTFYPPPDDLSFLTPMWAGMAAGITGRAVRYCEPFLPYAWPPGYETLPPDATPVALVRYMQNLLILTTAKPVLVTGSNPDSLDEQPIEVLASCIAPRSAVSVGHGAVWASPDGLMYFGMNGPRMLTAGLMTREDWQALNPESIVATVYKGLYIGFFNPVAVIHTEEGETASGNWEGFIIDPANPTGLYFLGFGTEAAYFDELTDSLYVLLGNVRKWDAGPPTTVTFKTKTFKTPKPVNFACAEVVSDNFPCTFKLIADGVLRHTQTVTSREPFWLPGGFLCEDWEVELQTTTNVQGCAVAETMEELKEV